MQPFMGLLGSLILANVAAWSWAFAQFHDRPVLLGTALLAWSLGLRHAVDADHIAAIDNVTRKLMQDGRRPVSVGFFFALGHSTVVILAAAAIAGTATALAGRFDDAKARFEGGAVPRPPHWGGYRVTPHAIEFWQDRAHRLHERRLFTRAGDAWNEGLLFP